MNNISIIHSIDRKTASLPEKYESAKQALAECYSIDECKTWADKAHALASYAKQADDVELEMLAKRIRGRAIRRMGLLLKEFDGRPDNYKRQTDGDGLLLNKNDMAKQAGLSERRTKQASRFANIPSDQFELMVDAETMPTIKELEEIGTKKRVHPKQGMKWFQSAYMLRFEVADLHGFIKGLPSTDILIEAMDENDLKKIKSFWPYIKHYMNEL